jgi:prophage regulatory protein
MSTAKYLRIAHLASTKNRPGLLPVSEMTIWRWVKAGVFPKPIKLSPSITAWDVDEVQQFIDARRAEGAA